jgi:hypothetical protein
MVVGRDGDPTVGFQPSMPPFSEAKMKAAGAEWPAVVHGRSQPESVLNT